jgi:hypothetical protein
LSIHPVPLVTHPAKETLQAVSVVLVVSSAHFLLTQAVVAVAAEVFQHLLAPLDPVKAAQVV